MHYPHFRFDRRLCWQVLLAVLMTGGWNLSFWADDFAGSLQAEDTKHVKLVVDYGDHVKKHFTALPWKEGMTALSALELAAKHPRGIKPAVQGTGEFTFVVAIDELKNEGNGKNWLFKVNGKYADRSCGIFKLQAGDEVTWVFTDQMP